MWNMVSQYEKYKMKYTEDRIMYKNIEKQKKMMYNDDVRVRIF